MECAWCGIRRHTNALDIMIRFDHRNFDVQGTERVFRKVVQPNQNGMRMVDKDGVPLRGPNTQALTRLHSNYVLSPRGVPTRKSNHAYSGQLAQAKMQNLVNSLDTNTAEMSSYASMHSYTNGLSSAGSSRHYIPVNVTSKKRAFGSGPARSIKSVMAKSASSQRSTRYLSSAPSQENIHPDLIDVEKTNHSAQGQRLEKEWSAMSQCRALKRSSEIVSHRVDRMYFMTGNKLKLQAKYNIEEDELQNLRELSQARAVSRSTSNEMRSEACSLMEKRESCENDRLCKIERKLSNIEHRLSYIEEKTEEEVKIPSTVSIHINGKVEEQTVSRSSSESGIHEGKEEFHRCHGDEDVAIGTVARENSEVEPSISLVDIKSKKEKHAGIQVWDILAQDKNSDVSDAMLRLFEAFPNVHQRSRHAGEKNEMDTVTELTLGITRKVRRSKLKTPKKQQKAPIPYEKELMTSAIVPKCRRCKCETLSKHREATYVPRDTKADHLVHSFPVRKPSIRVLLNYHPPVECNCRHDPFRNKGLSITGTQVPLCDREKLWYSPSHTEQPPLCDL